MYFFFLPLLFPQKQVWDPEKFPPHAYSETTSQPHEITMGGMNNLFVSLYYSFRVYIHVDTWFYMLLSLSLSQSYSQSQVEKKNQV